MARFQHYLDRVVARLPVSLLLSPFELFLAGLCVVAGLPLLVGAPAPGTVEALQPALVVRTWGAMLAGGGVLVIFGAGRRRVAAETAGLLLLGPASLAYAVSIVAVAGMRGLVGACITVAFGLACLLHVYALRRVTTLVARHGEP